MIVEQWLNPRSISEAINSQKEMASKVILADAFLNPPHLIAGMDVSNNLFDPNKTIYASVVLLSFPDLEIIETAVSSERQDFPYMTGLLGFREAPALIHAFQKLSRKPDLIMIDGHGISHPRGLGIASHLGVLFDIPTIGVAKSILVGSPAENVGDIAGSQVSLMWKKRVIGTMLRSKKRANPLIVSSGHRVSLETAVSLVLQSLKGYRLPEPTRQAHLAANKARLSHL